MQSQHAHLDMNTAAGYEPRVSTSHKVEELARAALKNVPGATKLIDEHFQRGSVVDPNRLLPAKPQNQALHLGW